MKKLWEFLNKPLIVAILSIALVLGLLRFGVSGLLSMFDENQKQRDQVEALGHLQVVSFAETETPTNAPQKYVGIVRNNSQFIVHNVEAAICAYDAQGKLIDVISRKLSGIGSIPPEQQREFYVERIGDYEGRTAYTKLEAAKTTIAFVAAEVTKEKEKAPNN